MQHTIDAEPEPNLNATRTAAGTVLASARAMARGAGHVWHRRAGPVGGQGLGRGDGRRLGGERAAMNHRWLLRIGAVAAITGALAQAAATVLEPQWSGDPGEAIRTIAGSGSWTLDRLLDLVGLLLVVGALAVVGRTLAGGPGRDWARMGQPLLAVLGALGASAVLTGATLKETAEAWATAGPAAKPAYLAVFAAASQTTDALFFGAFLALGVYLAALGAAILTGAATRAGSAGRVRRGRC